MPVAAAQLVLLTAAEDATLVGDEGFASALPLAASGPGEPFVTAAGVLGERGLGACRACAWRGVAAAGAVRAACRQHGLPSPSRASLDQPPTPPCSRTLRQA